MKQNTYKRKLTQHKKQP